MTHLGQLGLVSAAALMLAAPALAQDDPVAAARALPPRAVEVPALFWFSDADRVVRADAIRSMAGGWGGPVRLRPVTPGPGDDPAAHVLAGDILSPGLTGPAVAEMTDWLRRHASP